MSTRAIAPIVGVDQKTVVRDIRGEASASPTQRQVQYDDGEWSREVEEMPANVDPTTGEITDAAPFAEPPRTVTGLDGKTYTTPVSRKPNRRPITDTARS